MKNSFWRFFFEALGSIVSNLIIFIVFWFCISGDLNKILADIDAINAGFEDINKDFREITSSLVGDATAYR